MTTGGLPNAEPSIAILDLFPRQGEWRDGDYLALPRNRMVELVCGRVDVLSVPSMLHQFLARMVFLSLNAYVESRNLGIVMSAPTKVRIGDRHYREPDVLFVAAHNRQRKQEQFWEIIDLTVEIISPDDPERDLIDNRADYAAAGISEYWIVDPRDDSLLVLQLRDAAYQEVNAQTRTQTAASVVLDGFHIDVQQLFCEARAQ